MCIAAIVDFVIANVSRSDLLWLRFRDDTKFR